jgi:hypothetical protein
VTVRGAGPGTLIIKEMTMRIHVIQTGTVAIKQVQRHGRTSGNPLVNMLRDPTWTEPLPIYAFVIEHPEGLIVVDTGETATWFRHRAIPPATCRWSSQLLM